MTEDERWHPDRLSARERQIMEILFRQGTVTVEELEGELPDPPVAAAIRTMLSRLEEKGLVEHERDGRRNVYRSTVPREEAEERALDNVMTTFFAGSPLRTVAAILERGAANLSREEVERLERLIEAARRREES